MQELERLFDRFDSLIFFDTETTGLDAKENRVIELAAIELRMENGQVFVAKEYDSFVKLPRWEQVPEFITQLTGITDAMLEEQGQDEKTVADQFTAMVQAKNALLVAHNSPFDVKFVQAMLERQGRDLAMLGLDCLDTLKVYKSRRTKHHKLSDAIAYYGLEDKVRNSHRAIDDVEALIAVTVAMVEERDDLELFAQGIEEIVPQLVKFESPFGESFLENMDAAVANFKRGNVSPTIELSDF